MKLQQPKVEPVYCEVCNLPHRAGVISCESCGHTLGDAPDWSDLRDQVSHHKKMSLIAAFVTLVMGVLTFWSLSEFGIGFIFFAPLAWLGFHLYRVVVIGTRLPKEDA